MSDLIRKQDANYVLAAMQGRCTSKAELKKINKIWQQIKDLPSAEPNTGKYLSTDDSNWIQCSECGYFIRVIKKHRMPNYCSACGAKIKKDKVS